MTTKRWFFAAFCLLLGLLLGVPFMVRGEVVIGLVFVGIMAGYAAVLLLTRRHSETTAMLSGELGDERRRLNELRARGAMANVLMTILVGGFLVQVWRGEDHTLFAGLAAAAGVSYGIALFYFSRRG
ncbi:hypothetical protein [Streptosporangium roseum]|uniref:DUF2178 domain-containing protein n=1 Tax=Streptosporangium roseum (strain ATCC 12428 / DSM 43021 / JCM 3005 / KCTC 9067 / NCIMB 10171 / NRRL 2505 / NI 9100) TaxID=479432 RepID=D2B345_STRRD|nr:hypothetical protein [Streptosporangium roseum]ACZ85525.1 hypothetical protein Sros_2551 [Streptosporangium roseum DSM 43021]